MLARVLHPLDDCSLVSYPRGIQAQPHPNAAQHPASASTRPSSSSHTAPGQEGKDGDSLIASYSSLCALSAPLSFVTCSNSLRTNSSRSPSLCALGCSGPGAASAELGATGGPGCDGPATDDSGRWSYRDPGGPIDVEWLIPGERGGGGMGKESDVPEWEGLNQTAQSHAGGTAPETDRRIS